MIFNTYYWRLELGRISKKLQQHMNQRRWLNSSDASVEKCVMLGFYSIRKLLQAFQPPPNVNLNMKITSFPRNSKKLSPICFPDVIESFELSKPKTEDISLNKLCNQIIHSYFFSIWLGSNNELRGIFFSSDYCKDTKVFRMEIPSIVSLFDHIANSRKKFVSLAHFYPDNNHIVM